MEAHLRHFDICSGIGGFALGFAWAGLSQKPVAFCEIDPWCRKVLQHWWPGVPIFNDIKEVADEPDRIAPECDILTAGYPCQPFSLAKGSGRRGTDDARHIWPDIREVIASRRPAWVVCENVYGHVSMGLDDVFDDMDGLGYASWAAVVPACGVDAPHERPRLWLVSCRENGMADTIGQRLEAVWPSRDGHQRELPRPAETGGIAGTVPDPNGMGRDGVQGGTGRERTQGEQEGGGLWGDPAIACTAQGGVQGGLEAQPGVGGMVDGLPRWMDEPPIPRLIGKYRGRTEQIGGLGNAIVPQISRRIGEVILQVEETQ